MSNISMSFEQLDETRANKFSVGIYTEAGCSIADGEYTVVIGKILNGVIGSDDFDLVEECIAENVGNLQLPEEGVSTICVVASGEWEGFSWHKYYEIDGELEVATEACGVDA